MPKTIIVGDLHLRKEQPFLNVAKTVLDSICGMAGREDRIIFLGDFFHTARPYPEEFKVANDFFRNCKSEGITILAGNHEYLQTRDSFSEYAFNKGDFRFIDSPVEVHDVDCDYLFLPWVSSYRISQKGFKDMREYYADWLSRWTPKYPDSDKPLYVLYHFEDETVFAGVGEVGVDLSIIENKVSGRKVIRIGGHIHNPSDNYIGTPYVTRKDENGKKSKMLIKYSENSDFKPFDLPNLIEYKSVPYEELSSIELDPSVSYILSVYGVPSTDSLYSWANEHKGRVWIEDYSLKFGEERTIMEESKGQAESIREFLELFIKQNKVDSDTANYLLSVF